MMAPIVARRAIAVAFVVGITALASGCGGSDSPNNGNPPLSKRTFLFMSNAICRQGNGKLNAAEHKAFGKGKPSQADVASFVSTYFAPIVQKQIDDIRVVGLPQGNEDEVSQILDTAQQDLDKVKSDPSLLLSQPDAFTSFKKLAHPYGLDKCAPN